MGMEELSEFEREVLEGLWDHQQTSPGEPAGWFEQAAEHVRSARRSRGREDVESSEVIEALKSLERKGYVTKVGETEDTARFPIYRVSQQGSKHLNG